MSDAVIDDAKTTDDRVTLGGQEFPVHGPIVANAISEFETGIKIGSATYDQREHAFWTVLDDFSGGFGFRTLNARETLGTHWDNEGGVDLRQARHMILPPPRSTVSPSANPASVNLFFTQKAALVSDVGGTEYLHIAAGGSLFTLNASRTTLTKRADLTNHDRIGRIVEFTGSDGTRALYACGVIATAGQQYYRSTNGTTWTAASSIPSSGVQLLGEMYVWDGKIIAQSTSNALISTADGINWDRDAGVDDHWLCGGAIRFVGIAMAPWGAATLYFIDEGHLWALDWYMYNAIKIEALGEGNFLHDGVVWNGQIVVTDGWNVWSYDPAGETIRRLGLFEKNGVPPSFRDGDWHIQQFITGTSDLFAICRSLTDNAMRILAYNGVGWSWFGDEVAAAQPFNAIVDRFPINLSLTVPSRHIDVMATAGQSNTTAKLYTWPLPTTGDVPIVGTGVTFSDGPLSFETGWYDGGFADLDGVLLRLAINGYHITENETVKVEYRVDNDEDSAYTLLGTFVTNQGVLWFDNDHKGVPFRTVQFRITLDRGSDNSLSPEVHSLILLYDKKPKLRTSWVFEIDVSRMLETHQLIDGEPATMSLIWSKLRSLWNTTTMLSFVVPSVEPGGINVRIADMPSTFEDFRDAAGGRGRVRLQLLETVA